ncbi:hypothetical protein ACGFWI_16170 [Streptomyces sp. NPDC048434]|uniref:hypothetical protein n=1 Tax=Streptomyces sp. NPDC048434 TaxID=3365549 RepID=UPI00371EA71F
MARFTAQELRYLKILDELQEAEEVDVHFEERGNIEETVGEAPEAFALISEWHGIDLSPELQRAFLRFDGVSCHWHMAKGNTSLNGEFSLRHLSAAMFATGDSLIHEDCSEAQRTLYSEFRIFDDHPRTGAGTLVALRVQDGTNDAISPEIWHYDSSDGAFRLDIDYAEYLDALLITKGTHGWQYLYADVDLGDSGFGGIADDMRNMLEVFPTLFPDYEYEPLRRRLEERL